MGTPSMDAKEYDEYKNKKATRIITCKGCGAQYELNCHPDVEFLIFTRNDMRDFDMIDKNTSKTCRDCAGKKDEEVT